MVIEQMIRKPIKALKTNKLVIIERIYFEL